MKRPAVFFDRDNTLIVSDGYLGDPSKVVLVEGAARAIARAREMGFSVVVFSNQSGVARGMFTEEDVQAVNTRMEELLLAEDPTAVIDRHEFCPFHPNGTIDVYARESDRRKPRPGMILAAAKILNLDLERSWVVGDAPRDIQAGKAAGCQAVLFSDPTLTKSPAAEMEDGPVKPDHVSTTLADAMDFIQRQTNGAGPEVHEEPASSTAVAASERSALLVEPSEPEGPAQPPIRGVRWEEPEPAQPQAVETVMPPKIAEEPSPQPPPEKPAKRVPKVAIGSRYVPPEGSEAPSRAAAARREALLAREEASHHRPTQANGDEDDAAAVSRKPGEKPWRADAPAPPLTSADRVESLLEQILLELKRTQEQRDQDFSVSKLLAGVMQVITLAVLFMSYIRGRGEPATTLHTYLLVGIAMQTLTIALLIMSRQR
jgi:D-glycero-D-manno-heptose 1,7-bisphosphate phosphatase